MNKIQMLFLLVAMSLSSFSQTLELRPQIGWIFEEPDGGGTVGRISTNITPKANHNSFVGINLGIRLNRFIPETGIGFYQKNYSYEVFDVDQVNAPTKIGAYGGTTIRIPLLVNYQLLSFMRLQAGGSYNFTFADPSEKKHFEDAPTLGETYTAIYNAFNPNMFLIDLGVGLDWKKIGLDAQFHLPLTSPTNNIVIQGNEHLLKSTMMSFSVKISYLFSFQLKSE